MRGAKNTLGVFAILLTSGCASLNTTPQHPAYAPRYNDSTTLHTATDEDTVKEAFVVQQDDEAEDPADGEFWQQLRAGFNLSTGHQEAVASKIDFYSREAHQVERTLQRGEPYLAYICGEVRKRNFPNEIVLLPFIESGYDPYAYSRGNAAGLWQFIPGTGTVYGLKQDWWYDGRRDVVASTDAALNYLDKLRQEFAGDWLLALAAYNAGEGTIHQAMQRNEEQGKPVDFWHLDLPEETKAYVPKLLAISTIIKHPRKYGVHLAPVAKSPTFTVINTQTQLDLAVAAELADMNIKELQLLNPGFNRMATHPQGPHRLVVPTEKSVVFKQNLAALPLWQRVKWVRHKVERGETLNRIASRYDTSVEVLRKTNELQGNSIRTGLQLVVPVAAKNPERYASLRREKAVPTPGKELTHTVGSGDSLWGIARAHNVSVEELKKLNHLASGAGIKPGQQLTLRSPDSATQGVNTVRAINYTVRAGDTLFLISQKYNVSIADLKEWNGLTTQKYLKPGQRLKLYIDVARLSQDRQG